MLFLSWSFITSHPSNNTYNLFYLPFNLQHGCEEDLDDPQSLLETEIQTDSLNSMCDEVVNACQSAISVSDG